MCLEIYSSKCSGLQMCPAYQTIDKGLEISGEQSFNSAMVALYQNECYALPERVATQPKSRKGNF